MTDLTARTQSTEGGCSRDDSLTRRITEILLDAARGIRDVAEDIAAAAEEHYRPRVETPKQLDALPFLTVIREVFRQSPSGTDYGGIYERRTSGWQSLAGAWVEPGRNGAPRLPAVVLWTPGAGK